MSESRKINIEVPDENANGVEGGQTGTVPATVDEKKVGDINDVKTELVDGWIKTTSYYEKYRDDGTLMWKSTSVTWTPNEDDDFDDLEFCDDDACSECDNDCNIAAKSKSSTVKNDTTASNIRVIEVPYWVVPVGMGFAGFTTGFTITRLLRRLFFS